MAVRFQITPEDLNTINFPDLRTVLAAADRDRQFAEAVREMLDVLGPQQMTINIERLHIIHRDIYDRPCTATPDGEKEK